MPEDRLYVGPIYVKKSPIHGYGVFASKDLAADEVIEECYSLVYSKDSDDPFSNYAFSWKDHLSTIPLGFACIYNHSNTPNIEYNNDIDRGLVVFKTLRAIREGEELFSSYGKHWFGMRQLKMKSNRWWRRAYHRGGRQVLRASLIISSLYACIYALKYLAL
jgi:SET domain-containing protein